MRRAYTTALCVIIIAMVALAGFLATQNRAPAKPEPPPAYVGIAYCGDTVAQGKQLIDHVKDYSNLFVLQSGLLQRDFEGVNELGDYAVDAGMYFLPYFGNFVEESFSEWLAAAKERWGSHLVGVYYGDEPGGKMLDDYVTYTDQATGDTITKTKYGDVVVEKANGVVINYQFDGAIRLSEPQKDGVGINSEALFNPDGTIQTIRSAQEGFSYQTYQQLNSSRPFQNIDDTAQRFQDKDKDKISYLKQQTQVFTSDYQLYWFDYQAGYDVVLGQLGWNLSVNQQIAFLRGAADLQHKDWGAVITWKYQSPPYLDSGAEILGQLETAYQCGAKYLIIFNYYSQDSGEYGTMQTEHFEALHTFWKNEIIEGQHSPNSIVADAALVLPPNYGWGSRWAQDKIWGIYPADEQTLRIWDTMQKTLKDYGLKVNVVFEDPAYPLPASISNVINACR
ncbi:MAG: hypothetical protein NWE93_02455 [Candidatus Bathyarchaeota archaeon]|nr:hypothetical protein [Candidatus Bathyarchaeota archaeon]